MGVKASHAVTMHGLALNVATDLRWFLNINPCGFSDRGTTSIVQEIGRMLNVDDIKPAFVNRLSENLNVEIYKN